MILNYILIENNIFCNVLGPIRDSGRRTWGRSGIGGGWGKIFEKKMYLVGSTSIGQKSGPPVNRVFRWSILRITTFWAQIWNRSDPFYISSNFVGSFFLKMHFLESSCEKCKLFFRLTNSRLFHIISAFRMTNS